MKIKILIQILTAVLLTFNSFSQVSNQFDEQGRPDGWWFTYYEPQDGSRPVKDKGYYKNGLKDGLWIEYTIDGKESHSITYSLGLKNGEEKTYYNNGFGPIKEIIHWKNNKKDGEYILYRMDYRYSRRSQSNPDPVIEEIITYKNGAHNGKRTVFYSSGTIREIINYKNGQEDGEWIGYTEGGQIEFKAIYQSGIRISYYKF